MKKIVLLFTIALVSCNKSDIPDTPQTPTPQTAVPKPVTFTITPKPHDGGFGNFQVGETIGYDVAITDPEPTGATYVISPIGTSQTKHQIIDTDYLFDKTITKTTLISASGITLDKETGDFQIKILKPGSFYLEFALQKFVNGKKVGDPIINKQIIFSAVQFYLYVNYGNAGNRWDRDFFFDLNSGDQPEDSYFSDPNFTYTYSTIYCVDGGGYSGSLTKSGNQFAPSRRAGSGTAMYDNGLSSISCNGHNGLILDEIIVSYKSKNNSINGVIRYKNIPINKENRVL